MARRELDARLDSVQQVDRRPDSQPLQGLLLHPLAWARAVPMVLAASSALVARRFRDSLLHVLSKEAILVATTPAQLAMASWMVQWVVKIRAFFVSTPNISKNALPSASHNIRYSCRYPWRGACVY